MTDKYPFADELKSEFRDRGAAVSGMQATPTSELVHRAEMGKDPRVNVAEEAFRENYRARQSAGTLKNRANLRDKPNTPAADGRGYAPMGRPVSSSPSQGGARRAAKRPGAPASDTPPARGGIGGTNPEQARIPRRNPPRPGPEDIPPEEDSVAEEITSRNHKRYRPAGEKKQGGVKKIRVKRSLRSLFGADRKKKKEDEEEVVVRRGAFPVLLLALTLTGVMVVFAIVQSVAQVYQTSSEISAMNAELDRLEEEERILELKLDEKNDIRTIREIAVGELGMVDEDAMQRRFVTVSGGERIEILEAPEEEKTPEGVLFSALGATINRFFDRFR